MFYNMFLDQVSETAPADSVLVSPVSSIQATEKPPRNSTSSEAVIVDADHAELQSLESSPGLAVDDPESFSAPYKKYTITQGLHGQAYGHLAVDLSAGKGKTIKSPINGYVTDYYVDAYGNPTLVIENQVYRVTLLHGKFSVEVGTRVEIGQNVGVESNKGFVTDMNGRVCQTKACGYHTHLNVFDKRKGKNINPLKLLEADQ
jgi:murein DD-endopeptidase MepM/ murein hydrolase activator NlpD